MARLPVLALLLLIACGTNMPPGQTSNGVPPIVMRGNPADGGGPDGGQDGGTGDAGVTDGGSPDAGPGCDEDLDGVDAGVRPIVSELSLGATPFIELRNGLNATLAVSTLSFEGTVSPSFLSMMLNTGEAITTTIPQSSSGEVLVRQNGFAVFYVCWGTLGATTLQNEAISAQLWTTVGVCAQTPSDSAESLHLQGAGTTFTDWVPGPPTPRNCAP